MFRYTPRTIPNQVFVIGCGGTGSRLIPLLTQFVASISKDKNPRGWLDSPTIFLIDDDVVEQKNLMRQNFVAQDIGKHKATVLAQRYGKAYGVNVIPILKRVTGEASTLFQDVPGNPDISRAMVIMCVDTADARRAILNTVGQISNPGSVGQGAFYIDAGNEDNFGQVRFFNHALPIVSNGEVFDLPKLSPCVIDLPAIPMDVKYYDNMVDSPGLGSCADLDQTLAINAMMGSEIMGIVQNYFYVRPMTYNQVSVSLDGARSTTFNTPSSLSKLATTIVPTTVRLLTHSLIRFNIGPYLLKFQKETEKVMKAINKAPVEKAVEVAPVEVAAAPKTKRGPRRKVGETVSEAMHRAAEEAVEFEVIASPIPIATQEAMLDSARS